MDVPKRAGSLKKAIWFSLVPAMLSVLVLLAGCTDRKQPPRAVQGVLDLSQWDFDQNGAVAVKGDWEFYWHKFLAPADFSNPVLSEPTGFFTVPGRWDGRVINGVPLSYKGYATFKLAVRLRPVFPWSFKLQMGWVPAEPGWMANCWQHAVKWTPVQKLCALPPRLRTRSLRWIIPGNLSFRLPITL